jgi:prolyl-tRNA synthetase
VIVPIYRSDQDASVVKEVTNNIHQSLLESGIRCKVDDRTEVTPGFKFNDWEMRGVPLRIEIGPKDVERREVTVARRDVPGKAGKSAIPETGIAPQIEYLLNDIQVSMLRRATEFRDGNIHQPQKYDDLKDIVINGWAFAHWCESPECEAKIKTDTKATTRCIPMDQETNNPGFCIVCGKEANRKVYIARAY